MKYLNLYSEAPVYKEFKYENKPLIDNFNCENDINIFIGPNNSRKSRFMRYILNMNSLVLSHSPYMKLVHNMITMISHIDVKEEIGVQYESGSGAIYKLTIFDDFLMLLQNQNTSFDHIVDENFSKLVQKFYTLYDDLVKIDNETAYLKNSTNPVRSIPNIKLFIKLLDKFLDINKVEYTGPRAFLPINRSMWRYKSKPGNILIGDYITETYKDLYPFNEKVIFHSGQTIFDYLIDTQNGDFNESDKWDEFIKFLSETFFNNGLLSIKAVKKDQTILFKFANGDVREVYNLGDGLQNIILLLYPIFIAEDRSWIFIEEPELHLHPGLLTMFFNTISKNNKITSKKLKLFITTHSNHILNLVLDSKSNTSVFTFNKNREVNNNYTDIKQVYNHNNNILDLLGVKNSSVLIGNCSVWVEGVSDRKIMSAFLHAYMKATHEDQQYFEDYNYVFYEYAGSNLTHYLFDDEDRDGNDLSKIKAHLLSNKIFLLADEDKDKEDKHSMLSKEMETTFSEYHTTGGREIENILSVSILKNLLENVFDITANVVEKLDLDYKKYKDEGLGRYLYNLVEPNLGKITRFSDSQEDDEKSGTFTTDKKNKISDYIYNSVQTGQISWDHIKENPDAERLTIALYKFISKHNQVETHI